MPLYATNGEPVTSVMDGIGAADKEVEMLVYQLSPAFQRPVLSKFIDKMDGATIKRKANQRLINIYRQDNDYPAFPIGQRTSVAGNLTLLSSNSSFAAIPVGNMVYAYTGATGKVIAKDAGRMTISFLNNPNGNTAFVAADFAVGETAMDGGRATNLYEQPAYETVFSLPGSIQNIIPTYFEGCQLSKEDFVCTTYLKAANGTKLYATNKDMQAMQRMQQHIVRRTYSNTAPVLSGQEPIAAGFIYQIAAMGGTLRPMSGAWGESELKAAIRQYVSKGGITDNQILVTCGTEYAANFQDAIQIPYVQYVGQNSTLGTFKGINAMFYAYEGLELTLVIDPILDNQLMWGTSSTGFSRRSNTAIWGNTAPVKVEGGGTAPFVMAYYAGSTADVVRQIVPGLIDDQGNPVSRGANTQPYCTVTYTADKVEQLTNPRAWLAHGTF